MVLIKWNSPRESSEPTFRTDETYTDPLPWGRNASWKWRPTDPPQSQRAKAAQRNRDTGSWWLLLSGQEAGKWWASASRAQKPGPRTVLFLGYR